MISSYEVATLACRIAAIESLAGSPKDALTYCDVACDLLEKARQKIVKRQPKDFDPESPALMREMGRD